MDRFEGFVFDGSSGRLWRDGSEIRLTPKSSAVLAELLRHAGTPVTRDQLFERIWPDVVVSDDALGSCIQELRRALGDDARSPRFIETRHRRGYRFMPGVTHAAGTAKDAAVSGDDRTAPGPHPADASTRACTFRVTESTARRLDRRDFDPRLIGASLTYLDNRRPSDTLVLLLNAVWLDGSDLEPHLRALPYRCVAPTLLGFEPDAPLRLELGLRDHVVLLDGLLRHLVEREAPRRVVLAGFSASADLVLRWAGTLVPDAVPVDGVLALGPNQALATCFGSRVLARLDGADPGALLQALRSLGDAATSVADWSLVHGYVGRIVARFGTEVRPIRALARDICDPFERGDAAEFARMYREAAARARCVRCVFEDSETCNELLRAALLDHMENGTLGERHRDGALRIEPTRSHFELVQPARVRAHLDDVVRELSTRAAGR